MKISTMLEREDFYSILQKTLERNATCLGFTSKHIQVGTRKEGYTLFINPKLNAIMSASPAPTVIDFLKTEYNVGGSIHRQIAVKAYLWMATTFVRRFSSSGIKLSYRNDLNNLLIYPCNKKIRLFDFEHGIVYTVLKDGFPDTYIKREMAFRMENANYFIPSILEAKSNSYSERIIQGSPLARINEISFVENCKKKAYELVLSLSTQEKFINAQNYIKHLAQECDKALLQKPTYLDDTTVREIFNYIVAQTPNENIPLQLSHGDLQPGNIWIDDERNRLIIIDWETVKERSPFYDYAALYWNLRKDKNMQHQYEWALTQSKKLSTKYQCSNKTIALTILAEELAYQTEELASFPGNIGIKEYEQVIEQYKHLKL